MLLRARKLWKLVFLAACLVAVAVILSMWHMNTDETNPGSITDSDLHSANQRHVEEDKSAQQLENDNGKNTKSLSDEFEDDTNHGSIESDLHSANQRHVEEDKPTEQEHDYDLSDEFEVETNHGSIESDLHSENWQDVEEEKLTQQEHDNEDPTGANELYRAYDYMTTLLLFVGYSRSRHSLVSSLLDAHPHVIVADESYALRKWVQSPVWKTTKSKYDFFDTMMGSSVSSFKHGRRSRDTKGSAANLQIFGYNIPDQWQATYDRHIQVMGDKTAWDTAVMLRQKGTDAIYEMEQKLGVKVKFLHVVRNPFDNIATFVLRHREIQARTADPDIKINASDILDTKIQLYNNWAEGSFVAQQAFPQDFINVVSMDVVKKPAETLRKICDFLDITCSEKYIQDCAAIVDPVPSVTRHRIVWTDEQINKVYTMMNKFPFFERFTFEDE